MTREAACVCRLLYMHIYVCVHMRMGIFAYILNVIVTSIHYVVGFVTTKSSEISKPRDMDLEKSDRSDI